MNFAENNQKFARLAPCEEGDTPPNNSSPFGFRHPRQEILKPPLHHASCGRYINSRGHSVRAHLRHATLKSAQCRYRRAAGAPTP